MSETSNRRDIRDPEKLGQLLLTLVRHHKVPIVQAADELEAYHVPNYGEETKK